MKNKSLISLVITISVILSLFVVPCRAEVSGFRMYSPMFSDKGGNECLGMTRGGKVLGINVKNESDTSTDDDNIMVCALYNGSHLVNTAVCELQSFSAGEERFIPITLEIPEGNDEFKIKFFILNSSHDISPISEGYSEVYYSYDVASMCINTEEDALLFKQRPDSNMGSVLYHSVVFDQQSAILKFSSGVVDSTEGILSVKLKMHKNFTRYFKRNNVEINVYGTDNNWGEGTVTYASAPEKIALASKLIINRVDGYEYKTTDTDYIAQWVECDVTDYVLSRLSQGETQFSFLLENEVQGLSGFDSKESGIEYAPKLEIITGGYGNHKYKRAVQKFTSGDSIFYKDSNISYIDNKFVKYEPAQTIYRNGILYVPSEYAENYFDTEHEPELVFRDIDYISAATLAELLGMSLATIADEAFIITDNPEKYSTVSDEFSDSILNARHGFFIPPEAISTEGCVIADRNTFYDTWKARFSARNSDAAISELADDFFALLDRENPELSDIFSAYDSGDYKYAFSLYLTRFFEHLRGISELSDYARSETQNADKLYSGIKTIGGRDVYIGDDGEVNWQYGVDFYNGNYTADCNMINILTYYPLLAKSSYTGNSSYLNKWCDYIDGLYLNIYDVEAKYPLDSGMSGTGFFSAEDVMKIMNDILSAVDNTDAGFSYNGGLSYIRLITMMLNYYIPDTIVRNGVHPQNWNIATQSIMLIWSEIFKDFTVSRAISDIAVSRGEAYLTQRDYPDGVESQRTYNYDAMLVKEFTERNIKMLQKYNNDYYNENSDFYSEAIKDRADFTIRRLTNFGTFFQNGSTEFNTNMADDSHHTSHKYIPELKNSGTVEGEILNRLSTWGDNSVLPEITSDSFPYGGYYFIRDGWNKNNQFASFTAHNTDMVLNDSPNSLVLYAYGQLMLANNVIGYYSSPSSAPLTINGAYPLTMARWLIAGHQQLNRNSDKILPFKNYTSGSFDYAEGEYSGYYHESKVSVMTLAQQMYMLNNRSTDDSHKRSLNFLKDCGLWIVSDDVYTNGSKRCTLSWNLFCKRDSDEELLYLPRVNYDEIEHDTENKVVKTQAAGKANISLYNFSTADTTMTNERVDVLRSSIPYSLDKVNNIFMNNGKSTHITLIYPRENKADELENVREISGNDYIGIGARANGYDITYIAAKGDSTSITIGDISAVCKSIAVQEKDGVIKGMVTGCTEFIYSGSSRSINDSFEFCINNGQLSFDGIYEPLNMPEIKPGVSEFSGKLTVSLAHELGDEVDIIYTTDGNEPTVEDAQKYTVPFEISESATVKARAVRRGVTETPKTKSATLVSYTAKAYYKKTDIKPAISSMDGKELSSGANYKYYSVPMSGWGKLYMSAIGGSVNISEKADGRADIFDISNADVSNPFMYIYKGYFKADETGDYTFAFPDEYYRDDISSGYGLSVYIDGERIDASQKRNSLGTHTVGLSKGYHDIEIRYADIRGNMQKVKIKNGETYVIEFDRENNTPNFPCSEIHPYIFSGKTPNIQVIKPGSDTKNPLGSFVYTNGGAAETDKREYTVTVNCTGSSVPLFVSSKAVGSFSSENGFTTLNAIIDENKLNICVKNISGTPYDLCIKISDDLGKIYLIDNILAKSGDVLEWTVTKK